MSRSTRLSLTLAALLYSTFCFSQNIIRLKYFSTSKPVYFNTGTHLIVIDMRTFIAEYELIITNTAYWDSEKQVEYKEDGKPYRNELNYLLDSLSQSHDSVFVNEIEHMPHFDLRTNKMEYITQKNEFEAALIELLKKGAARIIDQSSGSEVHVISVKKRKSGRGRAMTSASWVVKEKPTQKLIFEKLIFRRINDMF